MFSLSSAKGYGLGGSRNRLSKQAPPTSLEHHLKPAPADSDGASNASGSFRLFRDRRKRPEPIQTKWDNHSVSSFSIKSHSTASTQPLLHRLTTHSTTSCDSQATIRPSKAHQTQDLAQVSDSAMADNIPGDRTRPRRERTYIGSECAVCDEPLEHMLQGERVLQFSCQHVSHEACFYEFIREFSDAQYCPTCDAPLHLDTSRGGNVLDIEKITKMVRSASVSDTHVEDARSNTNRSRNNGKWTEEHAMRTQLSTRSTGSNRDHERDSNHSTHESSLSDRYRSRHERNGSDVTGMTGTTGVASSTSYPDTTPSSGLGRRHDYDLQAMETTPVSPRHPKRNPIPAPVVTVRSEFPTINRSRSQQTLTCLVTVEVPDNNWAPHADDFMDSAPAPSVPMAENQHRPPSPAQSHRPRFYPYESPEVLEEMTHSLRSRVENWHGLDFTRFGKLRLNGTLRVGKDMKSWQDLECYLFSEMLICVKEKKVNGASQQWDDGMQRRQPKFTLKGSILIKKHLNEVIEASTAENNVLTLSLSVAELPAFHLRFDNRNQLKLWQQALADLNAVEDYAPTGSEYDRTDMSETEEDDWGMRGSMAQRDSSLNSSWGGAKSAHTPQTEYSNFSSTSPCSSSMHIPVDVVVVVPTSLSMHGVKINLVRDAIKFMVSNLGERDRMGLVTFGSSGGSTPLVGMTTKGWYGWNNVLNSIRPAGQKSHRADVVEGANVAMDLLMQRKHSNPIATIMLISDASTSDTESVDFVVSRAEAAKITIHSFGLGMTHKPDTMIELSSRTKASYTYVKDWMMLRECLAGCLGSAQSLSHQNAKLKLRLPEGSPARFHKISGALQITKRATGRDAEASLGDLRFGDKRDILVQLVITPDNSAQEQLPQDAWETIVSGLEALGGPMDPDDQRTMSVEELPLIQADLVWSDILREGNASHLPRPSLLAVTMLPPTSNQRKTWQGSSAIPPHPLVVQRRMELLTSDMLTRALTLVSRGQHERAYTLLNETRSILKGLGKGSLPPIPPPQKSLPSTPHLGIDTSSAVALDNKRTPSPTTSTISGSHQSPFPPPLLRERSNDGLGVTTTQSIDATTVAALDAELELALEWINHPAVFGRDSRKAVLQAIGVISSQRAYTFRSPMEILLANRIAGVRNLTQQSREWRDEISDEEIAEEP